MALKMIDRHAENPSGFNLRQRAAPGEVGRGLKQWPRFTRPIAGLAPVASWYVASRRDLEHGGGAAAVLTDL